jgi:hypothetical protein
MPDLDKVQTIVHGVLLGLLGVIAVRSAFSWFLLQPLSVDDVLRIAILKGFRIVGFVICISGLAICTKPAVWVQAQKPKIEVDRKGVSTSSDDA